jgi:hypothetical protein
MPGMFILSMKKERFYHKPGCYYDNLTGQGMRNAEVGLFYEAVNIFKRMLSLCQGV